MLDLGFWSGHPHTFLRLLAVITCTDANSSIQTDRLAARTESEV